MKAIQYANVATVQIIFNMFRHKPAEAFFDAAKGKSVGIIARVPLASGLLTGLYSEKSEFGKRDHRYFNREGAMFDKGETFSGVDYQTGLLAMAELKKLFPGRENLSSLALKWILMFEQVSCVIPGASRDAQLISNLSALEEAPLTPEQMEGVREVYNRHIRPQVHPQW
jgi:aryl-alcohol dehydrogenase-like predicted oxidoreductase